MQDMQALLVAYATTEGHTRKVAEFITERLRIRGHRMALPSSMLSASSVSAPCCARVGAAM
jgi:menaquinone-dependent protoporphyrinogen oxidase